MEAMSSGFSSSDAKASASVSASAARNPLMIALDVDSPDECLRLADALGDRAGAFKLGPRLLVREGAALVREVARRAPVFVDNKYLDIPTTMESAIRATFDSGASFATVHAWAGPEALSRLARVETELSAERPFRILAVTILTSFDQKTLPPPQNREPIASQVEALAAMAIGCGLRGLVCSPREVARLRSAHPSAYLVVPGIRSSADGAGDDQKRTLSAAEAIAQGASALVVGRPIIASADPSEATDRISAEINSVSARSSSGAAR